MKFNLRGILNKRAKYYIRETTMIFPVGSLTIELKPQSSHLDYQNGFPTHLTALGLAP